jgi:hypothetical protein
MHIDIHIQINSLDLNSQPALFRSKQDTALCPMGCAFHAEGNCSKVSIASSCVSGVELLYNAGW